MRLLEQVQPRAVRHRRRNRYDPVVLVRFLDQAVRKYFGVGGGVRRPLVLRPGNHIELGHTVILVRACLRRRMPLPTSPSRSAAAPGPGCPDPAGSSAPGSSDPCCARRSGM